MVQRWWLSLSGKIESLQNETGSVFNAPRSLCMKDNPVKGTVLITDSIRSRITGTGLILPAINEDLYPLII